MVVEEIRTITAKGQTTIPKTVRQALGVGYGARIAFRIENGTVTVHPADDEAADPALAPFLDLLARDIASRPEALVPLTEALIAQAERLTAGVTVDLDAPIKGDVELWRHATTPRLDTVRASLVSRPI